MTDLTTRIRRGLAEYADTTPVPAPPPFVAPEPPRRQRLGPALAAAAVAATVLAVVVPIVVGGGGGRGPGPGASEAPVTLPSEFAEYSVTTGSVSDDPPGRVIACFVYNTERAWNPPQVAVLATDSDRYRVVTQAESHGPLHADRRPVLLSGDGEKLAVGVGNLAVSVVDLVSGAATEYAIDPSARVDLLAWSPDGRLLAYTTRPLQSLPGLPAQGGRLMVLDADSGQSRPVDGPEIPASVAAAAFSPDGSLLAVQGGGPDGAEHRQTFDESVLIVRFADGESLATVGVPPFYRLAGGAAWSPDGSRLALVADGFSRPDQVDRWLRTLEQTGAGWGAGPEAGPGLPDGLFLGWQSRDRVVVDASVGGGRAIVSADLEGGLVATLSRPEVEGRSDMSITSLQLAYALLPDLQVRPAGPADRGPWPAWLQVGVAVIALLALGAALAVAMVVRVRLRSRPQRS